MNEIGAKVYLLDENSSISTPNETGLERVYSGEFVKLEDYEIALKRILELEDELSESEDHED